MNEQKIKELWWKARIGYNEQNCDPEVLDKFAELIIKECASVIQEEVSTKYKDGGDTEDFMAGHYAAALMARVVIRNHFGVEE